MWKGPKFKWTKKSQAAFERIMEYLLDIKKLSKPIPGEKLFLYLMASETALGSVLVRAKGQTHLPIYFIRQALNESEQRCPPLEKLATLVMSVRKLRPHFFDHQVEVLTSLPIWNILHRPDIAI